MLIQLGDRLKQLRKEKGLSSKSVAQALGIPPTTYSSYETGTREPYSDTLIKLADFHNCSIDYLLGITNERETAKEKSPPDNQIREALYQKLLLLDDETIQQVIDYVKYLIWREKQG